MVNIAYRKNGKRQFGACELSMEQLSEWFNGCANPSISVVPAGNGEPVEILKAEFLYAVSSVMLSGTAGGFKWVLTFWTPIIKSAEPMIVRLLPELARLPCGEESHDDELMDRFRSVDGSGQELQEDFRDERDERFHDAA